MMPNQSESSVFIKLSNGYNIGIEKKDIEKIELIEKAKEKITHTHNIKEKAGLKNILILHTGGTIASKVDYATGGVIARFTSEDLLQMIPELADNANTRQSLSAI
jgi:glutamyl-tRNA(Gln) amidotransferase subunit D